MKILDLNILLYAINRDSPHHARAKGWLEAGLNGEEPVAFAWVVLLGFLRLATSGHILPRPMSAEQAVRVVDGWLGAPSARTVSAGDEHWRILKSLLTETGAAGNLTTDTHLAALAIEHGATLCSTDADFGRFRHLNWMNPMAS